MKYILIEHASNGWIISLKHRDHDHDDGVCGLSVVSAISQPAQPKPPKDVVFVFATDADLIAGLPAILDMAK